MAKILDPFQISIIPFLLIDIIKKPGRTVVDIRGGVDRVVPEEVPYGDRSVWYSKKELDNRIAQKLHLPSSLWGSERQSNDLQIHTRRAIAKLRKQKIITACRLGNSLLLRLVDPDRLPPGLLTLPPMHVTTTSARQDMSSIFLSIIKSSKDNTYKFALGKTLLDYCASNSPDGKTHIIPYDYLAGEFLKHYWYQRYRFRMKQDFHVNKTPVIIQILESIFGENPPYKFKNLDPEKMKRARELIRKKVFGSTVKQKGMVVQRFQRIGRGSSREEREDFYTYDDGKEIISLNPNAHEFLRKNYRLLERALLAEWVLYLERANHGLPLLASKLSKEDAKRGSLRKYQDTLQERSSHCFYCNNHLESDGIHVDHFIPWSYIFDNNPWNLVLSCVNCNCDKGDALPAEKFIDYLIERDDEYAKNHQYEPTMRMMCKSLHQLAPKEGSWEKWKDAWSEEIRSHYRICGEYGFNRWSAN